MIIDKTKLGSFYEYSNVVFKSNNYIAADRCSMIDKYENLSGAQGIFFQSLLNFLNL